MDRVASEHAEALQQESVPTSCSPSLSVRSRCSAAAQSQGQENFDAAATVTRSSPSLDSAILPADSQSAPIPLPLPLSPALSHTHRHSCPLSIPSAPPLPPAIRIHNPHTLPSSQDDYNFINAGCNSLVNHDDDKWVSDESTMPFSPQYLVQLGNEKSGQHFLNASSSSSATFHPIQASIAPPLSVSLYHHTTFPQNPNPPNSHASCAYNSHHNAPTIYTTAPLLSSSSLVHGSSTTPSELEVQNNHSNHYHHPPTDISSSSHQIQPESNNRVGTASHFNVQPLSSTSSATRHERPGEMTGEDLLERTREEVNNRTRTNDVTSSVEPTESNDRAGSVTPSRSLPADNNRQPSNPRGSGLAPRRHVHISIDAPTELEPPVDPRGRLSLFRRTLGFLRKLGKSYHRGSAEGNQNHTVSRKEINGRGSSRRDETLRMIDLARKVPYSGFDGPYKTGIPGRNGEEPETNVFKYVGIMVGIPESPTLWQVVWKLFKMLVVMTVAYFALMALYFAAEYNASSRLENINILVVDLDHSLIGNQFLNFTQVDNRVSGQVNWSVQTGYNDEQSVINDVENGNYWGAMIVRQNASLMLNKALSTPLPDYNPAKAFLFVYDGGRDPLTVKPYVVASMYTQFLQFTMSFNPTWIFLVLTVAGDNVPSITPLADAPQVLGTPVAFEELDIHPPTASIITSATTVAYVWIFLVAGGSTYLVAHAVQSLTRTASVRRTMALLLLPLLVFLCSLSMVYAVILLVFGVPFESADQFVSLFSGMLLLQAAVASLVLFLVFLIPVVFIPAITVTFVMMNMIAVFHPVELMPPFYRWVYAMPFLNAVQMSRYVLMGSYNRLSYNLPILFAWTLVPLMLLPFAISRQKRLVMEVLALEASERQDGKRRLYSDKDITYSDYQQDDDDDNAHNPDYRADTPSSKRNRRSYETNNPSHSAEGSTRNVSESRRHPQRRLDDMDDSDYDDDYAEDMDMIENNAAIVNAVRQIRPLPSRGTFSSGAIPSAPPESQVFETHHHHPRSSNDYQRSLVDVLQLSRHPYATELVRARTPDEVK